MSTLSGILIGIGAVVVGNFLEGGHITSLLQFTAFLIVFGGTFGAVVVANEWDDIRMAFNQFRRLLSPSPSTTGVVAGEIVKAAQLVRRESLLSIEAMLPQFSSPFLRSVFRFVIDGVDPQILRHLFEIEIEMYESRGLRAAKVWSDAGGYAPTIGILGAVLGLIHVMGNLSDSTALGQGIAVAFIATVYGVGSANLVFLPLAQRIRRVISVEVDQRRMILEGTLSIVQGMNPYIIEEKMRPFFKKNLAESNS